MGSYAPVLGAASAGSSCAMENRDTFFFFLGGSADSGVDCESVWDGVAEVNPAVVVVAGFAVVLLFFFTGLLDTDRGLNITGFPTNLTSSAGFCPAGIVGCACCCDEDSSPLSSVSSFRSVPLLKPGPAPVFRLTPGRRGTVFAALLATVAALPAFLGGGRNEAKPLKAPPPVLARLTGGSSPVLAVVFDSSDFEVPDRLTTILRGLERSTTFCTGCFAVVAVWGGTAAEAGAGVVGFVTVSESESESE